ncbi:MAG TPA: hypothetical protein VFO10_24955 [Oligoflexus sp.]|uniref:hypothetical protein n=1 Tax=Oligoflexus sp. TaxID=1971216 RepID=UPI002D80A6EB|nr:hypothetical protein [Oligoflexus sp.]HET9240537.1 hypothetical protein [Oligoflexus sp.]
MEVRKIQITPEDETRLRELLKIHEADIDRLSDDELDAAEAQTSQSLQRLLQKQSQAQPAPSVLRFRQPLKTGTMAFLAAAAVMLFMQRNQNVTDVQSMVTKGTEPVAAVACDSSVFEVENKVNKTSDHYLKLYCGQPVYVHLGYVQGETLHLEMSNLSVSAQENVVMKGSQPLKFTPVAPQESHLMLLVTEKPLNTMDLSPADRSGLWIEELSLKTAP